jgi:hypothetical protein
MNYILLCIIPIMYIYLFYLIFFKHRLIRKDSMLGDIYIY